MQNSFLISHLRRLTKADWRELRKVVRSPWFNQRDEVVRLFDHLDEALNASPAASVKKETVWKAVFPDKAFDEKTLHYTASFLLKNLRQYLALDESQADGFQQQLHLGRALRKRGMEPFFEKEWAAAEALLEHQSFRNTRYHYDRYLLEQERAAHTMQQRRSGEMNLQAIHDQLTTFFIAETLRQCCTVLTHQTMSKQVYDLKMLDAVLAEAQDGAFAAVPAVAVYFHAYMALSTDAKRSADEAASATSHFERLKSLLAEAGGQFPPHELRDLYLLAINYCIKRLNRGEQGFIREAFELYRSGLEADILLENGALSGFTYKNISRLGVALGEHAWVAAFIEKHRKSLAPAERDNTWRYTLASFHFQLGEYGEAMVLLRQVDFNDVLNNLDARRMLLRSYFELAEFQALESLLDTFQVFIHRQKDFGYHRDNYLNLIRFVRRLMELPHSDKAGKSQLRSDIEATEHLAERDWLLAKLR